MLVLMKFKLRLRLIEIEEQEVNRKKNVCDSHDDTIRGEVKENWKSKIFSKSNQEVFAQSDSKKDGSNRNTIQLSNVKEDITQRLF